MEGITELCIVHDKFSEAAASGLSNKLSRRHNCIVWTEKIYQENKVTIHNKPSVSNLQKIIFLSENILQTDLPKDLWDDSVKLTNETTLVHTGNQYGISLSGIEYDKNTFSSRKNWWKYLITLVDGGIISVPVAIILWKKRKNAEYRAKTKMYLDAVKHLVEGDNIKKLFPE